MNLIGSPLYTSDIDFSDLEIQWLAYQCGLFILMVQWDSSTIQGLWNQKYTV